MPKSMREAIVKLLYIKKNDHKYIKNWRPIALLNTDYKILSKIIVNRLIPIFENYISPQQNTGLLGQRIENIHCNTQALLKLANQKIDNLVRATIRPLFSKKMNGPPTTLKSSQMSSFLQVRFLFLLLLYCKSVTTPIDNFLFCCYITNLIINLNFHE